MRWDWRSNDHNRVRFLSKRFLLVCWTVFCLVLLSLPVFAQKKNDRGESRPDLPIHEWLRGPERKDFKWKVELLPARMTFQQRFLVQVRAYVDVAPIADAKRDLYFLLKVADDKGNWLPKDTFNHYPLPPGLDKDSEIQYSSGLYAKPGKYTAALMLYDAVSGRGNMWRKQFEVKPPKNDPLPQLDRDLPVIEFIDEVPSDAIPSRIGAGFNRGRRFQYPTTEAEWPPGHGTEFLPVHNPHPTRVDVILNVAPWVDPDLQRGTSAATYRNDTGRMLQIGAVLSHLGLQNGCVRLGAVDLAKLEVVFDRIDGRKADWDKLTEQLRKRDHDTISVAVLGRRKSTAGFLRDYMTNLLADDATCGSATEKMDRVIVVVSHDFAFPSGASADRFWPDVKCACRYFHLRISVRSPVAGEDILFRRGNPRSVESIGDDIEKFLKPANPRRFDFDSPERFRRVLAVLIEDLNGGRERMRELNQ
jgi:hypothetical protein